MEVSFFTALIGMRGDTFIALSSLDQILSAEFLSKTCWGMNIDINQVNLTPWQAQFVL